MSRINKEVLNRAITEINSKEKTAFLETVDLQIGLKGYDPKKDKRFSGSIQLPHIPREKQSVIILGDQFHCDQAKDLNIPYVNETSLVGLNKDKKLIKLFFKPYQILIASESLYRKIPRIIGGTLFRIGKFPRVITQDECMLTKINQIKATVIFTLRKTLCLGVAVANLAMSHEEQKQNIVIAINYLVSLLKKNWHNIRSIYIKSTHGVAQKLYR